MSSLLRLISDIDGTLGEGLEDRRGRAVCRVADLFLMRAADFADEQVELFDAVIQRLSAAVELPVRMELAGKLAPVANAPRGVVRRLARDEIAVARQVLALSPRLDDQDLMAIALDLGRDHMLAICERPAISSPVTEMLVEFGDGVVKHAVAANAGARFSASAMAVLVEQAGDDAGLHHLLAERADVPAPARRRLDELGQEIARRRIALPAPAARPAADAGAGGYAEATRIVRALMVKRQLGEKDLVDFSAAGRRDCAILVMMSLTGLTVECLETIFSESGNDLPLVIGKAQSWSWRTVKAMLQLRDPSLVSRERLKPLENAFDRLDPVGAQRMVHFLKVRDAAPAGEPRPARTASSRR